MNLTKAPAQPANKNKTPLPHLPLLWGILARLYAFQIDGIRGVSQPSPARQYAAKVITASLIGFDRRDSPNRGPATTGATVQGTSYESSRVQLGNVPDTHITVLRLRRSLSPRCGKYSIYAVTASHEYV